MKLWLFISLLGVYLPCWTTADYQVNMDGDILMNVTITEPIPSDIDLSYREIRKIEDNAFDVLTHIKSLTLSCNPLEELPPSLFSKLINLEELALNHTFIRSLGNKPFNGLNNLKRLDVSHNDIYSLDTIDLTGLTKSAEVIIEENRFQNLHVGPPSDWSPYSQYEYGNPFVSSYESAKETMPKTFRVKLCMADDGTVQSLEEIEQNQSLESLGNCTEPKLDYSQRLIYLMNDNITRFERGWYKLSSNFVGMIILAKNQIADIRPELINDLPLNVMVDLSFNKISIIKKNIMQSNYCIDLQLGENVIQTIEDGAFEKICLSSLLLRGNRFNNLNFIRSLPIMIERLDLSKNNLIEIPPDIFQGLKKLKFICLSDNKLEIIEPGTFKDQENLIYIDLHSNRISQLHFDLFKDSSILETIYLSGNNITKIVRGTFSELKTSRKLVILLNNNKIDTIEEGSFSHLNISILQLNENQITDESIARGAFNMTTLESIELNDNLITSLNGESFSGIVGSYTLLCGDNPIKSIKNFFG